MIPLLVVIFLRPCLSLELISCNDSNVSIQGDYICKIDPNYDKTKIPGTLPLILDSRIYITDITEVNEEDNSITLHAIFNVIWIDPGLSLVENSK